ncbi:MAG: hypothetical protein J1F11_08705 [Oscillospiraceae bacterium]|nr:hypothetical protein [Oscillospiraceae bacterium]
MDKKASPGKIAGIIFCILAGICTVVLLFMDGYFSGQMKTIDKYYTSVARDDLNGFKSCFSPEFAETLTEADLEDQAKRLQALLGSEEIKTDVTFLSRYKLNSTIYQVNFNYTVYNDDDNVTEQAWTVIYRDGMKWVITMIKS